MAEERRGTPGTIRRSRAYEYDPENGYVFTREYESHDLNSALRLGNIFARLGIAHQIRYMEGKAVLSARDSSSAIPVDSWQIAQNDFQKSAFENPYIKFYCPAADLSIIAGFLNGTDPEHDTLDKAAAAMSNAVSLRLLDQMFKGSSDYVFSGYVLRHITNVGNRYALNVSDQYVDRIYTTAQLLSETQNALNWIYPLPGRLAYKLLSIPFPAAESGFLWGWLKRGSTETTAANNRIDIQTEYWLDHWSTDRYAPV